MLVSTIKVHDVRKSYEKRDTFYTVKFLNSVIRLVGLSCLYLDGPKMKYSWSLTKVIFLLLLFATLNGFNLFRKISLMEGSFTFTFKDFVQILFFFGYLQYIVDLYYVYKFGRKSCLEYFNVFDHIDKLLGMDNIYNNIRRSIITTLIVFTTFAVLSTIFDVTAWYISSGSMFIGVNMFDYIYVIMRQLTIADFVAQVIQIEYRLKVFGNLLHDFYMTCETLPSVIKDLVAERIRTKDRNKVNSIQIIASQNEIKKLGSCYLLVLEQIDYINCMYGIRVMGACLTILIDMIILMNLAIRILVGTIYIPLYSGALPLVSSIFRLFACALVLFCAMFRCEQTYKQSENVVHIIHYFLNNKKMSPDMKESLKNLQDLITARPVQFHAVKFYKYDYTLLLSVTSVVVTYTMIFMQNLK